jgi:putative heme-binding domain-containing protein
MTRPIPFIELLMPVAAVMLIWSSPAAAEQSVTPGLGVLEGQLLREAPAALAREAREQGDPARGAVVFFQPDLTCAKCHVSRDKETPIGPDLARPGEKVTDVDLIESILRPSKAIKKGFETVLIVTKKGITITGLVAEESADSLVLRDSAKDFARVTIAKADIEERSTGTISLMPAGLVNQLGTRQQFLDLARYVMEIAEKGPARARELQPDPALLVARPLPAYETDLDHAGLIAAWDAQSYRRGESIYNRLCINCHGTRDRPGSLPTSLRFASGKFKNGSDPYSMYQTLTRGFGMMTPQTWMVPRQKYDVIHYIREAYLKEANPSQYSPIDRAYLDRLPKGRSRGPEPSSIEPWVTMNYGPTMMQTFEVGKDGSNFAYKGIAVRLDAGPGGISQGRYWMLYDHDTLRVAAAWSGEGFIDWNNVQFTGQHEVHARVVGQVQFANPTGPGWANPADGSFRETRLRGRDGRPYGPIPRSWGHYNGLYHYGQQAIISYSVGNAPVLEMPGLITASPVPWFTRTFNIGPRDRDMVLQVASTSRGKTEPRTVAGGVNGEPVFIAFGPTEAGSQLLAGLLRPPAGVRWLTADANLRLHIPAGNEPLRFLVLRPD